jgi:cytoskeletal protein RodZ
VFAIGASLTAARQARGLELRDAEQMTCLRAKYLSALERERYEELPGRAYARAFLRTYATALDLHADRLVAEFDEQVPEPEPLPAAPPIRRRDRSWWPVLGTAVAFGALAIVGWSAWSGPDATPTPVVSPPAKAAASASAATQAQRAAAVKAAHVVQKKAVRTTPAAPQPAVIRADGDCWVLARKGGPTGAVLAEQTLHAGDVLRLKASHVWLRLGAPWNVSVHRGTHALHGLPRGTPVNVSV